MRNLECDLLTKWDKLRDLEESNAAIFERDKEKSMEDFPEVYKERDIGVILRNKRRKKISTYNKSKDTVEIAEEQIHPNFLNYRK